MRTQRREALVPVALAVGAFAVAFAQRPGWATSDTKINLHVAPGRFMENVFSMWTSIGSLGHVQSGQHTGYLFPMGPFFAAGHALDLSAWVVQRLWLGTLLALGAWGVVRLLDALLGRPRGVAHLVAGALYAINPFVMTYADRTTVTLLAVAVLPWLLLAVHRGLQDPRGWRWPAAVALLVTVSGGGINAAVTAWMLLGPALLLLYEVGFVGVSWRAARGFVLRTVPLAVAASLWWIVPLWVQSGYGIDFLRFTEQPGTVWGTTSVTESLRLMGFWISYIGVGYAGEALPFFQPARTMLFSPLVVVASLLVPALALAGYTWARRWRYGPFFLALALVALLVMVAGFPDGTPLRRGLTFTYNHVASVQFLRTTYKAAPLLAMALACLGGFAAGEAWRRLGRISRPVVWRTALAVGITAVVAVGTWPLVSGRAQDREVSYKEVPQAWRGVARDLDNGLPRNSRAMVLPGSLFAFYRWGGTVDPILPALTERPLAERVIVPYSDLRAVDLLWTIDGLVHQQRVLPGQLPALLRLIGVRTVVTATDSNIARSDAPWPGDVARTLAAQPGFARATRDYGPSRPVAAAPGELDQKAVLPEVRRYDLPSARGLVRVEPRSAPVIVEGSAEGIAALAGFGALPRERPLLYAADLSASELRRAARAGAEVVVSDSNRRRAFVSSRLEQNTGATLAANANVSEDGVVFDSFGRGSVAQTVAVMRGLRGLSAPYSPLLPQFPEHRPFSAVDGDPGTAWLADRSLDAARHRLELDFERPRDVPYVDLLPYSDAAGAVREVEIAGRRYPVHPGWNRLRLGLRNAASLTILLSRVDRPEHGSKGAGGIRELRVPGLKVREELRLPDLVGRALSGHDLSRVGLSYLFTRTTGDDPFRRDIVHGPWSANYLRDRGDGERAFTRTFSTPATRRFSADAWATVAPAASDALLDRLRGYRGPVRATSSSRFQNRPSSRASSALDGDPGTSWLGGYVRGRPAWIGWESTASSTVRRLRLVPAPERVWRATRVRLSWPGGATRPLTVGPDGSVALRRPVRSRAFRLEVLDASPPPGLAPRRRPRAVGIAEIRGAGLPAIRTAARAPVQAACGSLRITVDGRNIPLELRADPAAFDAGAPLRAKACSGPTTLAAGPHRLEAAAGDFLVYQLRLGSDAPRPPATRQAAPSGRVLDPGRAGRGRYDDIRLSVSAPSWLVLGESFNRGWRAWCDGRDLGEPSVVDGYANGWRVGPGCRTARFAFAPNKVATAGYVVSGAAGLLCVLLMVGDPRRRRRLTLYPAPPELQADGHGRPWPWLRALAVAFLLTLPLSFMFALRSSVIILPVLTLILRYGVGARALTLAAGALLGVVVPLLYLATPHDEGVADQTNYAADHLAAHWVGVVAVVLLMLALWRTLSQARGRRGGPAPPERPDAGEPEPELATARSP